MTRESLDKPVMCHRFIRWASVHPLLKESLAVVLTSLLRHITPVSVGPSGAEGFASARLTSSCLLRRFILASSFHPVPLDFFHVAWHQCCSWLRRLCVGSSDTHRLDRCFYVGSTSAAVFCRTRPIRHFFEFFLHVLFCLFFLLHP